MLTESGIDGPDAGQLLEHLRLSQRMEISKGVLDDLATCCATTNRWLDLLFRFGISLNVQKKSRFGVFDYLWRLLLEGPLTPSILWFSGGNAVSKFI
jgi:hypothetical protein